MVNIRAHIKSDKKRILEFLEELKSIITDENFDKDDDFVFIKKDKPNDYEHSTKYTLLDLEYNTDDVINCLLELSIQDYSETLADRDDDKPPLLFVFGKDINGKEIYIKLKNKVKIDGNKSIVCVSFHYAIAEMIHPYD